MTLGPVLVTAEAPRTAKLSAVPKSTGLVWAYDSPLTVRKQDNSAALSIIFMMVLLALGFSTVEKPFLRRHIYDRRPRACQWPKGPIRHSPKVPITVQPTTRLPTSKTGIFAFFLVKRRRQ